MNNDILFSQFVTFYSRFPSSVSIAIAAFRTIAYHQTTVRLASMQTPVEHPGFVSTLEADTHADTCVAGRNCVPLHFTDRTCDVQPYSNEYQPVTGVPIVTAATGYTTSSGRNFILIMHETLWMPQLEHSLFNPNQFRHFGTLVQDNPYADTPMLVTSLGGDFVACLQTKGTDIFLKTWAPSDDDLQRYPHIQLSSDLPWNPRAIELPNITPIQQEALEARSLLSVRTGGTHGVVYDISDMRRRIMFCATHTESSVRVTRDRRSLQSTEQKPSITLLPAPGPLTEQELRPPHSFLSTDRHSSTSAEVLSERWGLSIPQARMTLLATTRNLKRSALMPLARRYRADRMFLPHRIEGVFATDTMHMACPSIHGDKYCQIFANKEFFAAAYPISKKSNVHEPLDHFIHDYGAMDLLICDGAPEQIGHQTKFRQLLRKYSISHKVSEPDRPNQNPAEGTIREIRRRWYRLLFRTNCPSRLWCYGIPYVCALMRLTASHSGRLNGRTPIEVLMGETPDISEYLDFGWYDWVWYKQEAGLGEAHIGRFIGVSPSTGALLSYWILPASGIPIVRSTVQCITEIEKTMDAHRERMTAYNAKLAERFNEPRLTRDHIPLTATDWAATFQQDPAFMTEFGTSFDNCDIPEADAAFDPDSYDGYLDMHLTIDRPGAGPPTLARVKKRMKDAAGNPIGRADTNPMLDTRLYEVEYSDGHTAALSANAIAENLLTQVDPDGHRQLQFHSIIGHRSGTTAVRAEDAFITTSRGTRRRRHTTSGWDIQIRWHDGSTTWNKLKDVKDSFPLDLADYAIDHRIDMLPAFQWWVP